MAYKWDPFPFPYVADDDDRVTLAGVGAVMSAWESVEFEFARLYCIFARDEPDGERIREYGTPNIAKLRIENLARFAEQFFIRWQNQAAEGEFRVLVKAALGFTSRRNDVAHAIVMNVSMIRFFQQKIGGLDQSKLQFLLVPPYHLLKRHDAGTGFPSYALNGGQLVELAVRMNELEHSIRAYRENLISAARK